MQTDNDTVGYLQQKTAVAMDNIQSPRYALANVSPNVKSVASAPAFMKKTIAGSPLKRSFTAAMEDGAGLLYLKRRRLADDEVLSEFDGVNRPPVAGLLFSDTQSEHPLDTFSAIESSQSPKEPDSPSDDENVTQGSSVERGSFSSLINYDPPNSQTASTGISHADMLRLRLRVAMYKVRTNQTILPFEKLKDEQQCREQAHRKAIENAVAEMRREAQEVLARRHYRPDPDTALPPASPPNNDTKMASFRPTWPYSAEGSQSPEKLFLSTGAGSPLRRLWETSTPPSARMSRSALEPELTSSVVRGRVAEGLLGLRHAV